MEFAELVRQQTEPYDDTGTRVNEYGPTGVRLPPAMAIDIAMAIHELTTNAAKHDALSKEGATVDLLWRAVSDGGHDAIDVKCIERGGPEVTEPDGDGLGLKLLNAIARRSGFRLQPVFAPGGLQCKIQIRIDGESAARQ